MMFRSMIVLSAAAVVSAGFAEDTCPSADWVPLDNSESPTGRVRCCATGYNGGYFAACDTSSCVNNFNGKNRNCFNYGSPQNGGKGKDNAGSAICPYADTDHAICDTSYYNDLNGVNCRDLGKGKNVHCLGKVKCNTKGVSVPKNGHSDGTSDFDDSGVEECVGAMEGFGAGTDCFYNGASENWKVCEGPEEDKILEEEEEEEEPEPIVEEPEPEPIVEEPVDEEDPEPAPVPPPAPDSPSAEDRIDERAFSKGDPHFKTFGGELYDYHGECDLVLLHNPDFKEGLGMDIHIRTKIEAFWSSIESAVLKIGDQTLEIRADPLSNEWLWFDGIDVTSTIKDGEWNRVDLAGFLVRYKQTGPNTREANIYLKGSSEFLVMKTFKSFVRIDIDWKGSENYFNSVGLLGAHAHKGQRLGRDGKFIEDFNKFGQEWQVRAEVDGSLFHSYEGAVVGKQCVMPRAYHEGDDLNVSSLRASRRRLGQGALSEDAAKTACNHLVDPEEQKACVFDVIATQDLNMASTW